MTRQDDAAAVEVITTVQKKVSGSATDQANAMIEKFSKGKQVARKNPNQSGDQTQTMLVLQEGNQLIFHLFATNSKTNSLRHSTFECSFGRMESAGKIAQSVMTSMMMVE